MKVALAAMDILVFLGIAAGHGDGLRLILSGSVRFDDTVVTKECRFSFADTCRIRVVFVGKRRFPVHITKEALSDFYNM